MAPPGLKLTCFQRFGPFFVPILWIIAMCVATLFRHAFSQIAFTWMAVDFCVAVLFRLLATLEWHSAAGMRLDFSGQHRNVHFYGRGFVLITLYVIFYPFLFAWTSIGMLLYAGERHLLHGFGQRLWFFMFWLISFGEISTFPCFVMQRYMTCSSSTTLKRNASGLLDDD